jgi:arylsulfatase A-like enzyme
MFCRSLLLSFLVIICHELFPQGKPNIIYIMADDLGYSDLSCYGRKDYQTPNLDKLAAAGMRFNQAYSGSTLCTPTRASFMTGRYPARTPVGLIEPLAWTTKDSTIGLTPDYPSLPTLLKNAGYHSYLVGKWHLGFTPAFSPRQNGFDEFYGCHSGAVDYISHTGPRGNLDLYENEKPIDDKGYITELFMNKAIEIIKRPHPRPFFLSLMFNAPHWPWQTTIHKPYPLDEKEWRNKGSNEIFASMMKSLDEAIGKILEVLDQQKLSNNTVIIFTSDNGGERFSSMGIYSGEKGHLKEGGIRVPAFVRWPGRIPSNSSTDQPVITMDWTATILSLASAKPDPAFPLDGINLLPVLTDNMKTAPRTFYWRMFQRVKESAIRDGDWKYFKDEKAEYLFNLANDPSEKNDLREKEKNRFAALKQKYKDWEKTVLEPLPLNR